MSDQGLSMLRESSVVAAGVNSILFKPKMYRPSAAALPCLFGHMLFGSADVAAGAGAFSYYGTPVQKCARAGLDVVAADFAGTFGNTAGITLMQNAYDFAVARGSATTRLGAITYSMGTVSFGNWARTNLSKLGAWAVVLPMPDVRWFFDGNSTVGNPAYWVAGKPYIEAAYGGSYANGTAWRAAWPNHDPMNYASQLAGIPIRLFADQNDPFYLSGMYANWLAAIGGSAADMVTFNGGGHTVNANFDPDGPANFLLEHL